ncbi:MAG: DEAD/DEAH box helicase [Luteolibacter sp.]
MTFGEFGLELGIVRAVEKAGYVKPTPIQVAAIPKAMKGEDLIAIAQTGTGKTAAFVLPTLHRLSEAASGKKFSGLKCLVLAPTRELAVQIVENVESYGRHFHLRVAAIYGGVDEHAQIKAVRKGANIIVATPGRLMDLMERQKVDFRGLEVLVLDEADRMLHMGFLPDIEKIVEEVPRRRQTLMFSATFPKDVESLAKRFLYEPKKVQVGKRVNPTETVKQSVYEVPPHLKSALLLAFLKEPEFGKVLVFVRMKDGANRLTDFLIKERVKVVKLHSSRTQDQRSKALRDFKEGGAQVLVATDIVARGIDIDGVTHVVNYDFPVNPEDYVHRVGRTGRAEAHGEAISFVPKGDLNLLGILEMTIGERIERKRLRGFDYYAKSVPGEVGVPVAKKDWRKRTREMDGKGNGSSGARKEVGYKRAKKGAPKRK